MKIKSDKLRKEIKNAARAIHGLREVPTRYINSDAKRLIKLSIEVLEDEIKQKEPVFVSMRDKEQKEWFNNLKPYIKASMIAKGYDHLHPTELPSGHSIDPCHGDSNYGYYRSVMENLLPKEDLPASWHFNYDEHEKKMMESSINRAKKRYKDG